MFNSGLENNKKEYASIQKTIDWKWFWEILFLPRMLPLLLGVGLGISVAYLINKQLWHLLLPLVFVVPVTIIFNRYPFAAILTWFLIAPFFMVTQSPAIRQVYWLLHRALIPGTLLIAILADWTNVSQRERVRFGRTELATLIFLLIGLASIFTLTEGRKEGVIDFYDELFVGLCMYWLVRLINPTEKDFKRLVVVAFFTLIVQSTIGLLQWFAPGVVPSQWIVHEGSRTAGTFGQPAVYTAVLLFSMVLLIQYLVNYRSRLIKFLFILSIALGGLSIFFSFSRGSWLGGIIVLIGIVILYPRLITPIILVQVALVLFLATSFFAAPMRHAYERLETERTANDRLVQNYASYQMIQQKPFFGWGWNNYDLHDSKFHTRIGDQIPNIPKDQVSHNTFLSLMAELGIPAFIIYYFPFFWWLWLSIKVWPRIPKDGFWNRSLLWIMWLSLIDIIVVSNFINMISNPFGTVTWWFVMGLIGTIVARYVQEADTGVSTATLRPDYDLQIR